MRFFGMEIFQSGGTYSSLPSVPKNEIVLFEKDTVVLGYTLLSDVDDEVIYITKGSAAGGTAGGTDRGSWTLSFSTSNHTHGMNSHVHTTTAVSLSTAQLPPHNHALIGSLTNLYGFHYISMDDTRFYMSHPDYGIPTWSSVGSGSTHTHGNTGPAVGETASAGGEPINLSSWRPRGRCFTRQRRN